MATTEELRNEIIEVYIASFNRAPDADGLTYWVTNMSDNGLSISEVASSFFDSQEVKDLYPTGTSDEDFINTVYNNVLGRTADSDGLSYWLGEMQKGISKDKMIISVINGAKASTGSEADKLLLLNKSEVGKNFSVYLELNDLNEAKSSMALVSTDLSSVEYAKDKQLAFAKVSDSTVDALDGTSEDDLLTSTDTGVYVFGWEGNDIIRTDSGDDFVYAGSGNDTAYTYDGVDTFYGRDGNDTVYASGGDDILYGNNDNDSLHGEAGEDKIYGNNGDDYLYGDDGNDFLVGNDGNDYIYGGTGDDNIYGNDGDDNIHAGDGANFVDAGEGNDELYGGSGIDLLYGGAGHDVLYGYGANDILDGLIGDDIIYASLGDDTVNGNDGNDILYGDDGADRVDGEKGKDIIDGGLGQDTLTGGEGIDTFVFTSLGSTILAPDYITDFEYSIDKIRLVNQGSENISTTALDVSTATTLDEAINLAMVGDGSTNALIKWFAYEDNTYLVEDLNVDLNFNNTTDIVVKMQGIVSLLGLDSSTIELY